MKSLTLAEILRAKIDKIPVYHMKGDTDEIISHTDIDSLAKEADKCNGIIIEKTGPLVTDLNIIYVGGESKVLAKLK